MRVALNTVTFCVMTKRGQCLVDLKSCWRQEQQAYYSTSWGFVCIKLYLHAVLLHAPAGFEVGADTLACTLLELWELAAAGFDNGLYLFLWLLGDGHHAVQVLIDKQTHEHLTQRQREVRVSNSTRINKLSAK